MGAPYKSFKIEQFYAKSSPDALWLSRAAGAAEIKLLRALKLEAKQRRESYRLHAL